ncbi:rhodanese-like domain-containing protein [Flavisolibacter ginsenosidimutans]|uniref:Rhodanese-like domain-containing protein n=1 Tax=Flavisolibacter ginsenosidimutans TaxID=661481 RepID=A0A5B8UNX6_9BACT|nr:rhodanese-like domain-containing protein [Flavisolibacter ginsenosidimutans]QEC58156.1 rhodanese-like domain-containing protein [Flavisolibacter ginsenosidimutans]
MIQLFKNLFQKEPQVSLKELAQQGAQIVDVRTREEFRGGHLQGAVNIPLDELSSKLSSLDKSKPVITCCASGMRSATAKSMLKSKGFTNVHNGGGWSGLQHKLS